MDCSKCGQDNKPNALYCEKCGAELTVRSQRPVLLTEDGEKPVFVPLSYSDTINAPEASHSSAPEAPSGSSSHTEELRPLPKSRTSKFHKKLWIVLTAFVIVLALVGGLGFAFRLEVIRTIAPEKYLQMSLARTVAGSKSEASDILDLSKYSGKAVSHEFSVDTDQGSAEGSLLYDSKSEQALLDISAAADGTEYNGNQLYISPDLIAFSVPDLINDTDYLTIDPSTFADDCEEMGWGEYTSSFDLEGFIQTLFGKSDISDKDTQLAKDIADLGVNLQKSAVFSSDGSAQEKINGKDMTLDEMTYTIPEENVNEFYQGCISIYKEEIISNMDKIAAGSLSSDVEDQLNETFDGLTSLKIRDDLVIHYYIDKDGYTRKISIDDFEMYDDSADADASDSGTFGYEMIFGGTVRPTDTIAVTLRMESEGVSSEAVLNYETSYQNGIYASSTSLAFSEDTDDAQKFYMSCDIEWDTKDTKGENLSIDLEMEDDAGATDSVVITGTLTDDDKATSLSDAAMEITDADGNSTAIDFSYKLAIIDPSGISIDTSDSTSLFEYEPFIANVTGSY